MLIVLNPISPSGTKTSGPDPPPNPTLWTWFGPDVDPISTDLDLRRGISLLTFSSLNISEDFWVFLSFPGDRSIFSAFPQRNTAIAEKREENPEILTNI